MCCQTNAGDFYLRVTHWSPPIPPRGGFSDKWTRVKTLSLEKPGHGDCCQLEARTQGLLEYHWRCNEIFTAQVIINEITYDLKYLKKIGINKLLNDWQLNLLLWANTYMPGILLQGLKSYSMTMIVTMCISKGWIVLEQNEIDQKLKTTHFWWVNRVLFNGWVAKLWQNFPLPISKGLLNVFFINGRLLPLSIF